MMVTVLYTSSASSPTVWNRMAILTVSSLSNAPEAVIYSWKRCSHLLQFSAIFPFVLPHTRGSSHGQTRIIRKAYQQDFYTHMMEECYELWAQLEREAGVKLYRQTGLLVMGPEESQGYQMIKNTLQKNKVPIEILNRDNFSQHIPNVNLALGDGAMVDITAGVLYADRALKTVQRQFEKLGGVIRDNEQVTDVKPGPVVTVTTSAGVYRAKSVVVTAGPWANRLLAHTGLQLPLTVVKINVCYWKEKVPGSYNVKQRFPCFLLTEFEETKDIYGLPSNEYPGLMKICYHGGSETNPDQRDKTTNRSDIDILQRCVACCFPGLVPEPAVVESCLYTLTPDHHFVLDCHPSHSNIVFGAGFSGHGFKFGPIIGKLLCELVLGEVPSYDLSPFRIRRFQDKTKSAL
uniref:FAD dependent oxidoreductase domain-containing protein n=1 Tax=Gasterosteus aculeatus aculeatus TaxID=481459 RepID=A0AAQ4RCG3_GASAC|nr:peroxisomal sarcosine oxidase isoform X1 [Gasterosteus aculeatus aculeatus]XP_040050305.1 peroxisomal sarcosine oxidase isoform X1 [Gasterosteus aculeatus aculeatus]